MVSSDDEDENNNNDDGQLDEDGDKIPPLISQIRVDVEDSNNEDCEEPGLKAPQLQSVGGNSI